MTNEEKKSVYAIWILRSDGAHIEALQTLDYDKAYEKWQLLTEQWQNCAKEIMPFKLSEPVVTSFAPQLIYEITLKPVVETTASRYNNPYTKEMLNKGFGNTVNQGHFASGDVLDGGYKG